MNPLAYAAVGVGGVLGCWFRYWLATRLNAVFPTLPLGTLTANLIGGYIIGVAVGAINYDLGLSAQARLFVMTGFCGGLTTFSTYSAETYALFAQGRIAWGFGEIAIHTSGSLLATTLGVLTIVVFRTSPGGGS